MNNSKIDYLTMRINGYKSAEQLIDSHLGITPELFYSASRDKRFDTYNSVLRYGHITVLSDGPKRAGMCVDFTGQGCDEYCVQAKDPNALVKMILSKKKRDTVTRLDIAFDDHDGLLSIDTMLDKIADGEMRTRVASIAEIKKHSGQKGHTLYIGSEDSDFQVRIYDKSAETNILVPWIRVEMILRSKEAERIVKYLQKEVDREAPADEAKFFFDLAARYLLNKVAFIERTSENISRCPCCKWWTDFLETTTPAKLQAERRVPDLEKCAEWLMQRMSPSLVAVSMIYGAEWLIRLITFGIEQNNLHDERIIELTSNYLAMGFAPAISKGDEAERNLLQSLNEAINKRLSVMEKEKETDA